jgi:hypothetical protein
VTTFPFNWDATFDSEPADNENINLGAGRIRDTRTGVQVRMQVDHSWSGDANDGKHVRSDYMVQSVDPTLDAGDGAVYTKSIGGNTELFYKDSSGSIIQLTLSGMVSTAFPSGTIMLFMQAAPPPGWVQVMGFNDVMIRLVNDNSGGGGGGGWAITGINGVTDAHTLTVGEIPQHTHQVTVGISPAIPVATGAIDVPASGGVVLTTDGGTGGGGSHTHTISSASVVGDGTWRPAYVNVCAGVKS